MMQRKLVKGLKNKANSKDAYVYLFTGEYQVSAGGRFFLSTLLWWLNKCRNGAAFSTSDGKDRIDTYCLVRQNKHLIVDYSEGYRYGEAISSGFVESTINHLVAKRCNF